MNFIKSLNWCNIYTALWAVYYLQGAVYEKGSVLSQGILALLLVYSLFVFGRMIVTTKLPSLLKVMAFFLLVVSFYGIMDIVNLTGTEYNAFSFWKVFLIAFLPVFVYYDFSKKGLINDTWFLVWFIIFIISVIISYYGEQRDMLEYYVNRENVINNIGYRMVSLIPLAFFLKKTSLKVIALIIISAFIVFSMKRGAILIGGISIIVLFYRWRKENKINKFSYILAAVIIVLTINYLYTHYLVDNALFNERIEQTLEGDASGRSDLYSFFGKHILEETNPFRLFFGYGGMGTMQLCGMMAHNDWLELGIDMGLLGIVLYLIFWFSYISEINKSKRNSQCQTCLILLFIIMFGKSFFSMSFSDIPVYMSCVLGYSLAYGVSVKRRPVVNRELLIKENA